ALDKEAMETIRKILSKEQRRTWSELVGKEFEFQSIPVSPLVFRYGSVAPLGVLDRADVKKELDITAEQTEKIPGALMAALAEVLGENQLTRLKQLDLQQRNQRAFEDAAVRHLLKLTAEQNKNIDGVLAEKIELGQGPVGGSAALYARNKEQRTYSA